MGEPHVIAALKAKRAELAGQIEDIERRAAQLRADLIHIDAALHVFDLDIRLADIAPRRPVPRDERFAPSELARMVLTILRRASGPLPSQDIARAVMTEKGLDLGDARTLRLVDKRVHNYLTRHWKSAIEPVPGVGRNKKAWRVAG